MSPPFLADESCDFGIVRALRADGYQGTAVSEAAPGADDNVVIDLGNREKSILITEDKDFGQLGYASGHESIGILLVRYPFFSRKKLFKDIVQLVRQRGDELVGAFTVLQPGRVRIGRMPGTYKPNETP